MLRDVDIEIRAGEVHGLLGENGSGKSTFIKILGGFHTPDTGSQIKMNGTPVEFPLTDFASIGMTFVHQDLGHIPSLTVLENFAIARVATSRSAVFDWKRERRSARETMEELGLRLDLDATVAELPVVDRALLAIARASRELTDNAAHSSLPGLLVLDEPTVYLPPAGKDKLFALVHKIAARGSSVLFVTHDLDEALDLSNRVTVLRDGAVVGRVDTPGVHRDDLIEMILGRRLERAVGLKRHPLEGGTEHVTIRGLSAGVVEGLNLTVGPGEAVGLTGLVGSGAEEVPYALVGATSSSGSITVDSTLIDLKDWSPPRAVEAGIALVPADRARDGCIGSLSIHDNMVMPMLTSYSQAGVLQAGRARGEMLDLMERFDVRPRELDADISRLSGGNQQKALIAKWLQIKPRLLILHQPTQGVDVGAREEIFKAIRGWLAQGSSVLCVSADHEDLENICDRVLVFSRGHVVDELFGDDVNKQRIAESCYLTA